MKPLTSTSKRYHLTPEDGKERYQENFQASPAARFFYRWTGPDGEGYEGYFPSLEAARKALAEKLASSCWVITKTRTGIRFPILEAR